MLSSSHGSLYGVVLLASIWTLVWLLALATVLSRKDFDPVTRLTWVLVVILVPFFGVLLYWVVAPKAPPQKLPEHPQEATTCIQCKTTIPAGTTACPKCGWSYVLS